MLRFRVWQASAIALTMSLVFLGSAPGMVAAQAGIYTSNVTGNTLEWSADWMMGTSEDDAAAGIERRTLFQPVNSTILNIVFATQIMDREQAREAMLENFKEGTEDYQVIDSGDYEHIAYELSTFSIEQGEMGSFILVMTGNGTTIIHVIAPIARFASGIQSTQGSISIDGSPVLQGIDGDGLQNQLEDVPESSSLDVSDSETSSTQPSDDSPEGGSYTDSEREYTVEYPAGWSLDGSGTGDFDLVNADGTASVSFAAIEIPVLDGFALEMAMKSLFTGVLGPEGSFVTSESNASRAVFVGERDGTIVIQEMIVHSPSVVVVVTVVINGDYKEHIDQIREVKVDGESILSLL